MKNKLLHKEALMAVTSFIFSLFFIGFVVMLFPAIKIEIAGATSYKIDGLIAVFGGKAKENHALSTGSYDFNTAAFIGYFLALSCAILSIFAFRSKNHKKAMYIGVGILGIIAAILIFFEAKAFVAINYYGLGQTKELIKGTLSIGPWIAGISLIISGLTSIWSAFNL